MINIYNSQQFNLLKNNKFSVVMNKKLTKKEKIFLKFLYYSRNLSSENNLEISYKLEEILEFLNFNKISQFEKFLNNIISKRIFYKTGCEENLVQNGSFGIINSYTFYNKKVYLMLSEELLLSFANENLFSYLKIDKFIFMKEAFSYNLYLYLMPFFYNQKETVIELGELKKILDLETSYDRFYDFEKYILKKALKDIVSFSDFNLSYEKIKTGNNINNKVTAIKFNFCKEKNDNYYSTKLAASKLLDMITDKITDSNEMYNLILIYIIKRNFEYVYTNVKYTLDNYTSDIEKNLRKVLLFDLGNSNKFSEYILYTENYDYFSSPFILQMNLWKYLNKLSSEIPDYNNINRLYYTDFFSKIIKLDNKQEFDFNDGIVRIFIQYNKKENSIIKIFLHKNMIPHNSTVLNRLTR